MISSDASIVRVGAREVHKRRAQYYMDEGAKFVALLGAEPTVTSNGPHATLLGSPDPIAWNAPHD
ncbi:MAG: hypothetical protein ACRD3Y_02375 [Bryobacteraceae bacterium]